MKKKITSVIALAVLMTGLLSVYAFIQREKSLELHWLTENSRSQLDLMGDLLQNDLEKMKNQMAQVAALMESGQTEEAQKNLGLFIGVAALNVETSEFIWKTQAPRRNEAAQNDVWSAQWIQKTKETKAEDSDLKFFVSQSSQGEVRSALSVQANVRDHRNGQINKVRLIGIRSQALFQDYIDKLKVQGVHTFLTTQTGLTLAHSVSEYVGNSMLGDRTYEQIRNDKNVFGTIITQDVRGDDILSFYVKLPIGKLTLVSQWRKELWLATDWTFYGQGLFFILALALLAGGLAQYLLNRFEAELLRKGLVRDMIRERTLEENEEDSAVEEEMVVVESPAHKVSPAPPIIPAPSMASSSMASRSATESLPILSRPPLLFSTPLVSPEVREPQIAMKILDKVVSALRAPLLSVLGHVQMARLNPHGGALQSIETEVRNAKEVLDQMGQFSGQAHVPSVTVPLHEIVESALRQIEGALLRNNIKIIREIPADLAIKCDVDDFRASLLALFKNSIESMENSIRKTLFIRASKVNNIIQLEVEDSGEGIAPENLVKVLDPFFTTRSTLEHAGLGLSMVSGILRQHSAQMQLKSKPGEGTTITIKLPTSQDIVQPLAHCLNPQTISKFDGPPSVNMMKDDNTVMSSSTMKMESAGSNAETIIAENELFKSLNLFDDEDAIGDFQFGRLEFKEEVNSTQETPSHLSLGEKAAQEVLQEMIKMQEVVEEPVPVVAVPSKKLKKKAESYSKIKVQIPRPEEKI